MSLATSPARFAYCTDNYASTPATTVGTLFTAGANNVDGTAVSCIAALAHDVHKIRLRINGVGTSGSDVQAAGDLLIDPAGGTSWSELITDLVCGFTGASSQAIYTRYDFPLWIPAGASIGWRCKQSHTADMTSGRILVEAYGEPANPAMWWCGSGVETAGISDSKGTAITSDNASFGSWTSVGSPTTRLWKSVQMGINGSDFQSAQLNYHFELGYASTKLPGSGTYWLLTSTSEITQRTFPGPAACSIPVGTQMQARGMASGAPEDIYVALYGVY